MELKKKLRTRSAKQTPKLSEKQKKALKLLEELKGLGKGVWGEDAQVYVNRLRSNDRS